MASSLALCARLGVFEGDVYRLPPQGDERAYRKAFVWSVSSDEQVEMYAMVSDCRTEPRIWKVSIGHLKAKCTLLEENNVLRARAGVMPKGPDEARVVARA